MSKYPPEFYFRLFKLHLKMNGIRWTLYFCIRHFLVELLRLIENRMQRLEKKYQLPGSNSVMENALKWNHYRWVRGEEEWNQSVEWKTSVIEDVMLKNIPPDHVVLEIGPGYGRWTRKLLEISAHLIVVDVTEKCIAHCRNEFGVNANVEFHVNDGRSLPFVNDQSVDFVWSFDVFVHIEPPDVEHYLMEFRRILKPGGLAIIHHGVIGKTDFGWRSSLTSQVFSDLLEKHQLILVEQFNSWGESDKHRLATSDVISICKRA